MTPMQNPDDQRTAFRPEDATDGFTELTNSAHSTTLATLYCRPETFAEQCQRLSNCCADMFALVAEGTGRELSDVAEAADVLAKTAEAMRAFEPRLVVMP